jgi:hypothetical protein
LVNAFKVNKKEAGYPEFRIPKTIHKTTAIKGIGRSD